MGQYLSTRGSFVCETGALQTLSPFGEFICETATTGPTAIVQSGVVGLTGVLHPLGNIAVVQTRWSIPTSATTGVAIYAIIFSGNKTSGYSIVTQAQGTVAPGTSNLSIPATSGSVGQRAFAFLHDFTDDLSTPGPDIKGGPAVATKVVL